MSEVPHCPECGRADTVSSRRGPGWEYYCDIPGCQTLFEADDVTDAAWIDMVSEMMFSDSEAVIEQAEHEYADDCACDWCERGRPGMDDIAVA
jgi:hypothetical protein